MYCKNCGAKIDDNARFCSDCGHEQIRVQEDINFSSDFEAAKDQLSSQILTWGILSLAFSCTFILSLLGLIFSFVAKGKVKTYVRQFGPVEYRSRVGRDLSTAGLIVGLILSILCALYLFALLMIIVAAMFGM